MNRDEKIALIAEDLPLIREIKDGSMAEKVADVWLETMQHLLITHTPSQNMQPAYKEGVVFAGVDKCDWDMVCRFLNEN